MATKSQSSEISNPPSQSGIYGPKRNCLEEIEKAILASFTYLRHLSIDVVLLFS